jgi:hypothetical protein
MFNSRFENSDSQLVFAGELQIGVPMLWSPEGRSSFWWGGASFTRFTKPAKPIVVLGEAGTITVDTQDCSVDVFATGVDYGELVRVYDYRSATEAESAILFAAAERNKLFGEARKELRLIRALIQAGERPGSISSRAGWLIGDVLFRNTEIRCDDEYVYACELKRDSEDTNNAGSYEVHKIPRTPELDERIERAFEQLKINS